MFKNQQIELVTPDWNNDLESSRTYMVLLDSFWARAIERFSRWQIATGNRTKPILILQAYTRKSQRLCVSGKPYGAVVS